MSEREKWMPDLVDEVFKAHTDLYNGHGESTQAMLYRTGLRAQVAVMEELIAGQTGHWVDRAKAMIEEIRREIG